MKKMKRLFAVLLTLAMVLGMSVVTFAAVNPYEIPIGGEEDLKTGATYQYLQMIEPNVNEDTGWAFTSDAIADDFKTALGAADDQTAIWMLIKYQDKDAELTHIPANITVPEDMGSRVENAVKAVANGGYTLSESSDKVTVNDAGMYYIRAAKVGYSYNPMAAYVSFGYIGGVPSSLTSDGTNIKGSKISTEKSSDEATKVTEIGREVTYYVGSVVPFVPLGDQSRQYIVKDTINGADYVLNGEKKVELTVYYGKVAQPLDEFTASVKAGNETAAGTFTSNEVTGRSFTADLSTVLNDNAHFNQPIVIAYKAVVKDVTVGNNASIGDGTHDDQFGKNSDKLYTVEIKINKKDAKDNTALNGAKFVISKGEDENTEYAVFENNKFVRWEKPTGDAKIAGTEVEAVNGTVTVTGLGEGTYHITETVAPEGYSINTEIEDVTVEVADGEVASATLKGERDVLDTQLSALPSTGGIGTTIFTIAGCLIMIMAAGLFFATRRKSVK